MAGPEPDVPAFIARHALLLVIAAPVVMALAIGAANLALRGAVRLLGAVREDL